MCNEDFRQKFVDTHNEIHKEGKSMNIAMFNDPDGKTSSTRIIYVFMTVVFMVTWSVLSINAGAMIMIDPVWIGILGIPATQRAAQSFAEHKK